MEDGDLVNSEDISSKGILELLQKRFQEEKIYSSVGPIIIALNPYKQINNLFSDEIEEKYRTVAHPDKLKEQNPPHIWKISQNAFSQMVHNKTKQAIVISGESGG
jgi:myosin heavy subunit